MLFFADAARFAVDAVFLPLRATLPKSPLATPTGDAEP